MLSDSEVIQRVESAYAGERFEVGYDQIVARAGRRRRPYLVWLAPLATAAVAAALVASVVLLTRPLPSPVAAWEPSFVQECARIFSAQAKDDPRLTPQQQENPLTPNHVFSFQEGELGLRLYIFDPVMFACTRDADGWVSGTISGDSRRGNSFLPPRGDHELTYVVVFGPVEYLVGRMPPGSDRAEVRMNDGGQASVSVGGGFFAAWAPRGGLAMAFVGTTVADPVGTSGGSAQPVALGPPTYLRGDVPPGLVEQLCYDVVVRAIAGVKNLPADESRVPDVRLTLRDGTDIVFAYASDRIMTVCGLGERGAVTGGGLALAYDGDDWSTFGPYQTIAAIGEQSWLFGLAPTGTESVQIVLESGRRIAATYQGGYFGALWHATPTDGPTKLLFQTSQGTIERDFG